MARGCILEGPGGRSWELGRVETWGKNNNLDLWDLFGEGEIFCSARSSLRPGPAIPRVRQPPILGIDNMGRGRRVADHGENDKVKFRHYSNPQRCSPGGGGHERLGRVRSFAAPFASRGPLPDSCCQTPINRYRTVKVCSIDCGNTTDRGCL